MTKTRTPLKWNGKDQNHERITAKARGRGRGFDVIYVAVLPFYRQACISFLSSFPGIDLRLFAGTRHVDPTIRTGIDASLYEEVSNHVIAGKALMQIGGWNTAIAANTTILDLNPRSLAAWGLLIVRRLLRRRTLVWGHLHPRAGGMSRTAVLRRLMRRLSEGTILYGYDSVPDARSEVPGSDVWVAPNSLYGEEDLIAVASDGPYANVLYVGRLVKSKKVDILIRGFLASRLRQQGVRLIVVGEGSDRNDLERLATDLGGDGSVLFTGHISDVKTLRELYENSLCSVSPGYVGLGLTQSLGFGVPMVVSRNEPHAPEIELIRLGEVTFFDTDSADSLAEVLDDLPLSGRSVQRQETMSAVRDLYSAEAMANGLMAALSDRQQALGDDGWPT